MPNIGLPIRISRSPTVFVRVPMIVNFFGSLSGTVARSGGVTDTAALASEPYVADRFEAR